MALFLSSFEKKVDKKGRLLVPSAFRAVLNNESFNGIVVYPSFTKPCIEACSMSHIEKLTEQIDMMDAFSDERDAFASTILGASEQLGFDKDGRIMISEGMLAEIGIDNGNVLFVGKGQRFEIWQPKEYAAHAAEARKIAKEKRRELGKVIGNGGALQ